MALEAQSFQLQRASDGAVFLPYAGRDRVTGGPALAEQYRRQVRFADKYNDPRQDLSNAAYCDAFIADIEATHRPCMVIGPPCSSMGPCWRNRRRAGGPVFMRTRSEPAVSSRCPAELLSYVQRHNSHFAFAARAIMSVHEAGGLFILEQPSWCGDADKPFFWAEHADTAHARMLPVIQAVLRATGAHTLDFSQCMKGHWARKNTWLAYSPELEPSIGQLRDLYCPRVGDHEYHQPAFGEDHLGRSLSQLAGGYSGELWRFFLDALVHTSMTLLRADRLSRALPRASGPTPLSEVPPAALLSGEGMGHSVATLSSASTISTEFAFEEQPEGPSGGRITDGLQLHPAISAAVTREAQAALRFSSFRCLKPASASELFAAPLPSPRQLAAQIKAMSQPDDAPRPQVPPAWQSAAPCAAFPFRTPCEKWRAHFPSVPPGPVHFRHVCGKRWEPFLQWMNDATACLKARSAGRAAADPGPFRIHQSEVPIPYRHTVWDFRRCSIHCQRTDHCGGPISRSTRDTVFPAAKQASRAAFRFVAEQMGWDEVDPDIVQQHGEGGVELRSDNGLLFEVSLHHMGTYADFDKADATVRSDVAEQWAQGGFELPPTFPFCGMPRNMVYKLSAKVDEKDGTLSYVRKGRITHDLSFGEAAANAHLINPDDARLRLPTVQAHGRAQGTISAMGMPREQRSGTGSGPSSTRRERIRALPWGVDLSSAYQWVVMQFADTWMLGFVWYCRSLGRLQFYIYVCLSFGGRVFVSRFERIGLPHVAYIQQLQGEFLRAQNIPAVLAEGMADRRQLQSEGLLDAEPSQALPTYIQEYIDDIGGTAPDFPVSYDVQWCVEFLKRWAPDADPLTFWQSIPYGEELTRAFGGEPPAADSCVVAFVRIAIVVLNASLGSVSVGKTMAGTVVAELGILMDSVAETLSCPVVKRAAMRADCVAFAETARAGQPLDRATTATLVGRAVNMSQIWPSLLPLLHGGYAVANARKAARGRASDRPLLSKVRLKPGGARAASYLAFLDELLRLLDADASAAMAPSFSFDGPESYRVWVATHDASGNDGVGGYLLSAAAPGHVWLLSHRWPEKILAALAVGALPRAERPDDALMLSTPVAEAAGGWLLCAAASRHSPAPPPCDGVISIGDCQPAVFVTRRGSAAHPAMRAVAVEQRRVCLQWLGVHVPRELNLDADRLSHPDQLQDIVAEAEEAGFTVHVLQPSTQLMDFVAALARPAAEVGEALDE